MQPKQWKWYLNGFEAYLLLERALLSKSIGAYLSDVKKLMLFLEQSPLPDGTTAPPQQVTKQMLMDFLYWLNDMGIGASSQARVLSGVRAFFLYLFSEGIIGASPADQLDMPRIPQRLPSVLSVEDIGQMLQIIDLSKPEGMRNRAMLETLYACGLRVSELIELKISNLFFDMEAVRIIGKGEKVRLIPIGGEAIKYLQLYMHHVRPLLGRIVDTDHVFLNKHGKHLSRVMVFQLVKQLAAAANISQNVSPHTFRHSFATHLLEGGADLKAIQDMLGHSSVVSTQIYTHVDTRMLRETLLCHHPRYAIKKD